MNVATVLAELQQAWNAGDGAAWAAHFSEDADFVDVLGRIQRGRQTIAAEHQKILDTVYLGSRLRDYRQLDASEIAAGVLVAHTTSTLSVPDGPRAGEWRSVQTKVFHDGQIVAFQNTMLTPLAEFADHDEALAARAPQEWRPHP